MADKLDKFDVLSLVPQRLRNQPIWYEDSDSPGGIIGLIRFILENKTIPELRKLLDKWDFSDSELEELLAEELDYKGIEELIVSAPPEAKRLFAEAIYNLLGTPAGLKQLAAIYGFEEVDILDSESFDPGECPTDILMEPLAGAGHRAGDPNLFVGTPLYYSADTCIQRCAIAIRLKSPEVYSPENVQKLRKLLLKLSPICTKIASIFIEYDYHDRLFIGDSDLIIHDGFRDLAYIGNSGVVETTYATLVYGDTGARFGNGATYGGSWTDTEALSESS